MAAQIGTQRATWLVIGIVTVGVVVVISLSRYAVAGETGVRPHVPAVWGPTHRQHTSESRPFTGADATAVMGSCSLDLVRAQMSPGQEAFVDIFAMMGSVTIRVPSDWSVDTRAMPVMGSVRDNRSNSRKASDDASAASDRPRLVLRGVVMMGSVLIRS